MILFRSDELKALNAWIGGKDLIGADRVEGSAGLPENLSSHRQ